MVRRELAWVAAAAAVVMLAFADEAEAGKVAFGKSETIHVLQPTEDPQYNLGYKTTMYFFIAGCYVRDDGYVLQKAGEHQSYIPLTDEKRGELQRVGLLPDPLPEYSLSFFDYLFGYSNWIILALVLGAPALKQLVQRARTSPNPGPDALPEISRP